MTAGTISSLRSVLAPVLGPLAADADRIDRARRLTRESVAAMRAAGLFRLLVPRVFGGLEVEFPEYLEAIEDIAAASGSAAWCVAVAGGVTHALAVQFTPEQAREALTAAGAGAIFSGTLPPLGTATPTGGGYRVTGRWPFASLTEHADWRMVGAAAPGPPDDPIDRRVTPDRHLRYCLLPPGTALTLHDTWHSLSMQGSGSCDIELDDVHIPDEHTAGVTWNRYRGDMVGVLRVPFAVTQGMCLAAISCGVARAAQVAFIERAHRSRGNLPATATVPALQLALADAAVALAAGRAVLARESASAWDRVQRDHAVPREEHTPWWIAAQGANQLAVHAVERLYAYSGANALYDSAPMQRYFRDVRVAQHHIHLHPGETAQDIGRTLLGLPAERHNW